MDIGAKLLQLQQAIKDGPDAVTFVYNELLKHNHSPSDLLEFAFQVLENCTSDTGYTAIYKAGLIIEKWATPAHLPRLEMVRKTLPPLKGLRDYRYDFDHYIQLLKSKELGICDCRSYASTNTNPSHENFSLIFEDTSKYLTVVACKKCGKKYEVITDLGYHFPQYHWSS